MRRARNPDDPDARPTTAARASQGSFFGRRKGHKLRSHQADLIDNLLPRLALDIGTPAPENLAEMFEAPPEDVRLEIGFGGGEHLIAEALAFPNTGFIGCEPYVNGMAKILTQIEAHNIGNIRLFAGDAAELLAWAPARSLVADRPDPSRSLAKAAALEAALCAGRHGRGDGAGAQAAAANSASSATSTITSPGRWRICRARPILSGSPSAPTTGACRGPATP